MASVTVRTMADPSDDDIESAVQILVDAFKDDIGMESFSGGSARLQRDILRRTIRGCLAHGQVYLGLVDGTPRGVATVVKPGHDWAFYEQDNFTQDLSAYLDQWYNFHICGVEQYIPTYEELYRSAFPSAAQNVRQNAWNVKFLAVAPNYQRRGVGRALLGAICKQADAGNQHVTADVKSPSLVQWFTKAGFAHRAVKNFTSKDSAGFPLWCMAREPVRS
ncbi:acyl-CoA N-acyltransferase [Trametes meyenii]|nr:acyl-CoA N-acyltransferase [Trametes meyenii]